MDVEQERNFPPCTSTTYHIEYFTRQWGRREILFPLEARHQLLENKQCRQPSNASAICCHVRNRRTLSQEQIWVIVTHRGTGASVLSDWLGFP
jgi:hypothetical protein